MGSSTKDKVTAKLEAAYITKFDRHHPSLASVSIYSAYKYIYIYNKILKIVIIENR